MSGKDQYTASAGKSVSLSQKLDDLHAFIKKHKTVMLVTRSPSGSLHSRVMVPADITKDMKIRFIYDRDSYKDKEVENDSHVNVAINGMEGNDGWASISGKAGRVEEEGLIAKLYNPTLKAWFGDKGDGVHTGGPEDPRMAIIEVKPDEIRHYHQTRSSIGTAVDVVASAISGSTATPGEVRTITSDELASV
ncbi:hypothetical protein BD324DRAFT_619499 [Kockovaella imperatae]|uniref:General stress protein FMN-binding split barrel domain-containing protein n=1 Tax=Kockovaella imperatae TaxID=4999 RepID=A0A1Y1UMW0_9TREE|nr:hypothetical protein BD324DRAFT_619499 [Kockovaella imperatae]ORX39390.1 hypothetical protein BD324DRAFT_619499 [Kockovaella imperatae]